MFPSQTQCTTPPLSCVSIAFAAKTLPLPCVSIAFASKTLPFLAALRYRNTDEDFNRHLTAQRPNVKCLWRITHQCDEVPAGNPESQWFGEYNPGIQFNYLGLGREVWYPSDDRPLDHVVCDQV